MSKIMWQYCKDLNDINNAIGANDNNWEGLNSAKDIISITYDSNQGCYVVIWRMESENKVKYKTKNQIVKELVYQERYKEALQICKDWNYANPNHRDILQRGYDCFLYPGFYQQLGYDPLIEYQKAVNVLNELYR